MGDYPEEYDFPEHDGDTLGDLAAEWGFASGAEALRANDRHGDGATVSLRIPGAGFVHCDDTRELPDETEVEAWVIHGIAWDGTDWEYSEEVRTVAEIQGALDRFDDALAEHEALADNESYNESIRVEENG